MAKQSINLRIEDMSFPFDIDREKEEVYRLAEREVNRYVARIKQQQVKNWENLHYLAFTALYFAINNVSLRRSREVGDEDLRRLEALESEIDNYMNALR